MLCTVHFSLCLYISQQLHLHDGDKDFWTGLNDQRIEGLWEWASGKLADKYDLKEFQALRGRARFTHISPSYSYVP